MGLGSVIMIVVAGRQVRMLLTAVVVVLAARMCTGAEVVVVKEVVWSVVGQLKT